MARMIYGCGADSFYATKLEMHDPYVWVEDDAGKTHVILSELEVSRGRKNAQVDYVHAMGGFVDKLQQMSLPHSMAGIVAAVCQELDLTHVDVPADFPAGMFKQLLELGVTLTPVDGSFFPERAIKTADEIACIRTAQHINEQAFYRAFEIFKEATIGRDNTLHYKGDVLTSELVQSAMNTHVVSLGGVGFNGGPIVAGGLQAADPHQRGFGPLKAGELVIIDSFPAHRNAYHGDLTRTILKGEPSEEQVKLYDAVKASQQKCLDNLKAGMTGAQADRLCRDVLISYGYETSEDKNGNPYGFFHSTGHALGLDVHDDGPGLSSRNEKPLKAGMVVTVEPGLYYPDLGGCRLEDIVAVSEDGIDNLTTLPKELLVDKL